MARLIVFLAVALFAAAVVADSDESYIYTEEQTDELDARIAHCVRAAADVGEEKAAGECHWKGVYALDDGAVKEAVTGVVVACLEKRAVATRAVTQVRECLEEAMARDV